VPSVPSLKPWGPWRRAAYGAVIGLAIAGALFALRRTRGMETLELRLVDVRTRAFLGDVPADPRIVLAVIDDASHRHVMQSNAGAGETWPWRLELHALAMDALAAAKVRAVMIDIFHLERGRAPEDLTLTEEQRTQGWVATLTAQQDEGTVLADAYRRVGNVALAFKLEGQPSSEVSPARVDAARERLLPDVTFQPREGIRRDHVLLPLTRPTKGATLMGFANVLESDDGVFRRAVPGGWWGETPVASLALSTAFLVEGRRRAVVGDRVLLGRSAQALDEEGGFYIHFRAEPGAAYTSVSPADLVAWGLALSEGKTPEQLRNDLGAQFTRLEGAVVVYGVNLSGGEDIVTTPLSGGHLGPEVQATILDNLLRGDGRVRVPALTDALILFSLALVAGVVGALLKGRWWPHVPSAVLLGALFAAAWGLFAKGRVIDLMTPVAALVLTWGATSVLRLATEGRRNKWLEGTFGRYVSPEVIDALKKDPRLLQLGGRRRDLTVLFSDVAGFTRISESLAPEMTVRLLNRYLTTQSAEVMGTGGVIDKFQGDAVMAFWGDPIEATDHALRAVKAALRCLDALPTLDPLLKELGLEHFHIRIGLNSGPALVGNMGSEARFDYTCMGDSVNLASRLEGANKQFASRLMVGPITYLLVKEHVVAKRLADLVVVGRSAPVRTYEVLSLKEDADEDTLAHAAAYGRAHMALRSGDVTGAFEHLAEAESRRPGDGPTAWLRALAGRMRKGEAATPWDGTWRLTEK
jgi:adenylate cyclase